MAKNIVIGKLDLDTKNLFEAAEKTKKQIDELIEKQGKLSAKGKESSEQYIANSAALKGLQAAYREQTSALSAQINEEGKLVSVKEAVKEAVKEVNKSENDYINNNNQLLALKKNLNSTDSDYEKRLAKINAKLQENNNWLQENGSAHAKLVTTMSDYKQQIAESFDSINIFNGGLTGFVSRAQEAGGTGPLLKNAFGGITGGIKGMGAAVAANPVGAVITAIVVVVQALYDAFKDFKPLMDKVEQGMAAVDAIVSSLKNSFLALFDPAKSIGEIFSGMGSSAVKAADGAIKLKKAQQELNAEMELQEVRNKRSAVLIQEQIALSENQTLSEEARIAAFKRAAQLESKNYDQRKSIANESYNSALTAIALGTNLTDKEIANLQRGGFAYAQKLQKTKQFDEELLTKLKEVQNSREDVYAEEAGLVKRHNEGLANMHKQFDQDRKDGEEKQNNEALQRRRDFLQKQKDLLTEAAQKQKLLLDQFLLEQGDKANSLKEEQAQAQSVYDFKMKIAKAEYDASDKKSNDLIALHIAEAEAKKELLKSNASATVNYANAEYALYMEEHKTLLDGKKILTDGLIAEEQRRLDDVKAKQLENLALNQDTSDAEIKRKRDANEQLSVNDTAYLQEKLRIEEEYQNNKEELGKKHEDLEKAAADKKLADRQVALEVEAANATTKYDQDIANEQIRYEGEIAKLKERKDQGLINEQQYHDLEQAETKKHTGILKGFNDDVIENKITMAQNGLATMAGILGKESAAGKAVAVAQATIDTYKAAVSAYSSMSGIPVVGPALGAVAAAAAVAAGIANVKKITGTKTPKAEKGALFNIGGNRHSNGGTLFTGADGTRFEAEQGELIGVMNRNAAAHFMAFNNAFPAGGGSAPNYFANGGIVSREIASPSLNTDELAAKIALANSKIPAPVVAVQDIVTQGNSYVQVRDAANF